MIEAGDDAIMGDQRLGEGQPRCVVWRGEEWRARLLAPPERLIEAMEYSFGCFARMEPPLKGDAGQIVELPDALQAEPLEEPRDVAVEAQGLDRKRCKRSPDFPLRHDDGGGVPEASKRVSAAQGLGKGNPSAEAEAGEAHRHVGEKSAGAAKEMRDAGHVEP